MFGEFECLYEHEDVTRKGLASREPLGAGISCLSRLKSHGFSTALSPFLVRGCQGNREGVSTYHHPKKKSHLPFGLLEQS